jgi:CRISPR/Cas system-associated exonuclease Cas4 (RecB family)
MATLQKLREQLHLSASAVRMYVRCPAQYQLHYVVGAEADSEVVPIALVFGSAIHHALACFYTSLKDRGRALPLKKVTAEFREVLTAALEGPVDLEGSTAEDVAALGERVLGVFHAQAGTPRVLAVEQAFSIPIVDPDTGEVFDERLVGGFDAVIEGADGRPLVLEHKTAGRRWSDDQLRYDLQGAAYALAMQHLGHAGPTTIRYQILTKTKDPAAQVVDVLKTAQDLDDIQRTLVSVLRAVDAGIFYPIRGWQCDTCGYQQPCTGVRPETVSAVARTAAGPVAP